jgi:hypothetical protein
MIAAAGSTPRAKLISQPVVRSSCRIQSSPDRSNLVVLEGTLREPDQGGWFRDLVVDLHARALRGGFAEVVLDLRAVEYANPAVWKSLVSWFRLLRDDPRATYTIRILCDQDHRWQQVGVPALRVFGHDRLVLEVYRGDARVA